MITLLSNTRPLQKEIHLSLRHVLSDLFWLGTNLVMTAVVLFGYNFLLIMVLHKPPPPFKVRNMIATEKSLTTKGVDRRLLFNTFEVTSHLPSSHPFRDFCCSMAWCLDCRQSWPSSPS